MRAGVSVLVLLAFAGFESVLSASLEALHRQEQNAYPQRRVLSASLEADVERDVLDQTAEVNYGPRKGGLVLSASMEADEKRDALKQRAEGNYGPGKGVLSASLEADEDRAEGNYGPRQRGLVLSASMEADEEMDALRQRGGGVILEDETYLEAEREELEEEAEAAEQRHEQEAEAADMTPEEDDLTEAEVEGAAESHERREAKEDRKMDDEAEGGVGHAAGSCLE